MIAKKKAQFKAYKAYVSSSLSFLAVVAGAWITDTGDFTPKEFAAAVLFALASSGVVGIGTYQTKNPPK